MDLDRIHRGLGQKRWPVSKTVLPVTIHDLTIRRDVGNMLIDPLLTFDQNLAPRTHRNMRINPFLNFDGRCEAAIRFYEEALGARVLFKMTWGESPMAAEVPAEARELIMHSTLAVGDGRIMCADALPGRYERPAGVSVSLHVKDAGEGERIFRALSENGEVTLPYGQTFWSCGFGMCVDRFGIPWIVNCEQEP